MAASEAAGSEGGVAVDGAAPLGMRLRGEREAQGLSLRELARRLEVSPSLVSQIETGKIQPSVKTLYAMVSELGVSFDGVFGDDRGGRGGGTRVDGAAPREAGRVQRGGDRRAIELESGVRWERLTPSTDDEIEFLYAIYEVGGESGPADALVRHNGREFGIVLQGRLGVTVGFDEHVLESGDSITFESTIPHRLHNDSDEVVVAIWVVHGRYGAGRATRQPFSAS